MYVIQKRTKKSREDLSYLGETKPHHLNTMNTLLEKLGSHYVCNTKAYKEIERGLELFRKKYSK